MTADPTETVRALMPFAATLGIELLRYDPEEVCARLTWAPELCTSGGALHGGAVMALADSAGGACAYLNLPPGAAGTTTVESKTNFKASSFSPGPGSNFIPNGPVVTLRQM